MDYFINKNCFALKIKINVSNSLIEIFIMINLIIKIHFKKKIFNLCKSLYEKFKTSYSNYTKNYRFLYRRFI